MTFFISKIFLDVIICFLISNNRILGINKMKSTLGIKKSIVEMDFFI